MSPGSVNGSKKVSCMSASCKLSVHCLYNKSSLTMVHKIELNKWIIYYLYPTFTEFWLYQIIVFCEKKIHLVIASLLVCRNKLKWAKKLCICSLRSQCVVFKYTPEIHVLSHSTFTSRNWTATTAQRTLQTSPTSMYDLLYSNSHMVMFF